MCLRVVRPYGSNRPTVKYRQIKIPCWYTVYFPCQIWRFGVEWYMLIIRHLTSQLTTKLQGKQLKHYPIKLRLISFILLLFSVS
jgi:uncharacterized membrane protein